MSKRPLMILAHPRVAQESSIQATPAASAEPAVEPRLDLASEPAGSGTQSVDIAQVAERVYQLLREDLAVERIRRGLKSG